MIPELSLRASYGYSGNYDNTVTAFTTAIYTSNFYSHQTAAAVQGPPNMDLRWERIAMLNLAVDFATKNRRIYGSIEYYHKRGKDLIGYSPIDPTTGFTKYKGNTAGMTGNGWEFNLNTKNVNGIINWQTAISVSLISDKITSYKISNDNASSYLIDPSVTADTYSYSPFVGRPLFGIYALKWAGLDPNTGDPMGYINGKPSKDYPTLNSVKVDSLQYMGRATPNVYGVIRNTVAYGPVSLSFSVSYRFGYFFRKPSVNYYALLYNNSLTGDYGARWQKPGDEATTNVPSFVYPVVQNRDLFYARSAALIEKGDNIRLQDINFSYELPSRMNAKLHLRHLQVFAYVNNIGILYRANKAKLDPDFPNYPLPRTLSFGLRGGF